MKQYLSSGFALFVVGSWIGCQSPERPLDAETKQAIDSISTAQIRILGPQLDSQCVQDEKTLLPLLIDSIKKVRLREIEEKLRNVPLK